MSAESIPWNQLLRSVHHRQVVPVIGPGLVTVAGREGETPFVDWLAPQLAARLGVAFPEKGTAANLNEVACAHLIRGGKRKDIYEELRELVEAAGSHSVPRGLADLAAIRDFDLFVTSTFDDFLAKALRQARPGYKTDERGIAKFHPSKPTDLPQPLPGTFLYHVLGAYDTYPDFAVWEEDYIEFLCGLLSAPKDTLKNLLRELGNRSLLLIGAPFDDWIVRFFMRIAKNARPSDRRDATDDYLADVQQSLPHPMVFYFDQVAGSLKIIDSDPVGFAAELRRRWSEKYDAASSEDLLESIPDDMERGCIFLSYSRDDIEPAARLASGLKAAGIPVWLDKKKINPGGDWQQATKRAVKSRAALFLSLISAATERDPDRFAHQERAWAAEVHVPGEIFYIPVVIDDTRMPTREPEVFSGLHRYELPGGQMTPEFAARLRRYLDQYHQEGEIRDV